MWDGHGRRENAAPPSGATRLHPVKSKLAPMQTSSLVAWALVVLLALGFCWRLWTFHAAVPRALTFHDTQFYERAEKGGLFTSELWAGERAPLFPLVLRLLEEDPGRVRTLFVMLSGLSWVLLALAVSRLMTSPLKPLAALLVFSLGLSHDVVFWNECMLSESLSFSCGALCLAAVLMFQIRPAQMLLPVVLSTVAFGLARDSNGYLLLMLAIPLAVAALVFGLRKRPWWPQLILACTFAGVFLLVQLSANRGERWLYPLTNVIVSRVLPNSSKLERFTALGMPSAPGLRPFRSRRAYSYDRRLRAFRDWLKTHGKQAYARDLITHPRETLSDPDFEQLFGAELTHYVPKGTTEAEPKFMEKWWQRSAWRLRATACLVLAALVLFWRRLRQSPLAIAGLALAVFSYPHSVLIWHGDAMEVPRHGAQVAFQLQVALVLLLAALLDALLIPLGKPGNALLAFARQKAGRGATRASRDALRAG